MIANARVRGALPASGQPKTPATIPHSHRQGKEFRHRSSRFECLLVLKPSVAALSG